MSTGSGPRGGGPEPATSRPPRSAPAQLGLSSGPVLGAAVLGPLVDLARRGLLGRRRILLVGLLALAPVGVAAILVVGQGLGAKAEITRQLYDSLVMATVVPLVGLILGTAALGAEIEDGTVVQLLVKPIGRAWIVLAKMLVAAATGAALCGTSVLIAGLLLVGLDSPDLLLGMLAGAVLAVVAYTAVFVSLSVWTGRALIAGLAYVLLWEGFVASLFSGTRFLSIREYGLSVAAGIAGPAAGTLARDVPMATGLLLAGVVTVIAFELGARRLARFEVSDAG